MTDEPVSPDGPEQLRAEIEQTREELGRTAEQLVAKTDVKARAQAKVTDLTERAKDATSQVPGVLKQAREHRTQVIIAVGVLVALGVGVRIWTRR
jgi:Protein of unknown function (DUF3618)